NGKLILQVMSDVASKINFEISYITPYASWTPFYDLRAESVTAPLDLMYKAQVAQNTGIDWKKVKLTLSSGSSNQNNQIPILSSWFLRYHQPISDVYVEGYRTTTKPQSNVIQSMSGQVPGLEIQKGKASIDDYTTVTENQLNVSFDIDIPYDILSNGKLHSVALKELKLPAKYTYY